MTETTEKRKTKIVATLGPSCDDTQVLQEMIEAGMDCARLNCSHASKKDLIERTHKLREASRQAKKPIALLFDLQGPKLRLGNIAEKWVEKNEVFYIGDKNNQKEVYAEIEHIDKLVSDKSEIIIGDGFPKLQILDKKDHCIKVKVIYGGRISARKGFNVTYASDKAPILGEKDLADLQTAIEMNADFVALSFVRNKEDMKKLRQIINKHKSNAKIIAKIEKVEGYQNLNSILEVSDGVLVARGDYGVEAGVESVPLMQKETISLAKKYGKLVVTATQMLESMIQSPFPTRAEATDVANAVLDGTSAVMLSAETAVGNYPVKAVQTMASLSLAAEKHPQTYYSEPKQEASSPAEAIMRAAVILAYESKASAIVVPTSSGGTVRACIRYRPRHSVYALCYQEQVANQLALEWGVYPYLIPLQEGVEETIKGSIEKIKEVSFLNENDLIVITAGPSSGYAGATNLVTLRNLAG